MYRQFFGFTKKPFDKGIKPGDFFKSDSFIELENRFEYIKNYRGIMILTGEPGTGKTSAIRYLIDSVNQNNYYPVYLPLSTVGVSDFYRYLNKSLNAGYAHYKSDIFKNIQDRIIDLVTNKNIIPIIIFDEAHLLRDANFQELQIISNIKCDSFDPAIYILVGQNVLLDKLNKYILNSFYQRITLKYRLANLDRDNTKKYILQQFKLGGCHEEILTESAFDNVFKFSKGALRVIGAIVNKALILASIEKKRTIEGDDIVKVTHEVI
jgi:type II secretory pathway predicted ATPase ExeA